MAEIKCVILWGLLALSILAPCTGSFKDAGVDKVEKKRHLRGLSTLDSDTRWQAHMRSNTLTNSEEISQTLVVIDPIKAEQDRTNYLKTEEDSYTELRQAQIIHDSILPWGSSNQERGENTRYDFNTGRNNNFMQSQKLLEIPDTESGKIFLATSDAVKLFSEHMTSGLVTPATKIEQAPKKIQTATNPAAVVGNESGVHVVTGPVVELMKAMVASHRRNPKYVLGRDYKKHHKSDILHKLHKTQDLMRNFENYVGNKRGKRNVENELPDLKNTENNANYDSFDDYKHESLTDVPVTETQVTLTAENIVDGSNDKKNTDMSDDIESNDNKDGINHTHNTERNTPLFHENNYTPVILNKTGELNQGVVSDTVMIANSYDISESFISATDKAISESSDLSSLSENISPTTTTMSPSLDNSASVILSVSSDIGDAQYLKSTVGPQIHDSNVDLHNNKTTVGSQYDETTVGTQIQDTTVGTQIQDTTLGLQNHDITVGPQYQDTTLGTQNQNTTVDLQNQETTVGLQNQDTTVGLQNQDTTVGLQNQDTTASPGYQENTDLSVILFSSSTSNNLHYQTLDSEADLWTTEPDKTSSSYPYYKSPEIQDSVSTDVQDRVSTDVQDSVSTDVQDSVFSTDVQVSVSTDVQDSVSTSVISDAKDVVVSESIFENKYKTTEFSLESDTSSNDELLYTNSFTAPTKNISGDKLTDNQETHFPTYTAVSDVYEDNESMAVTWSEDKISNFPLAKVEFDWELAKQTWQVAWEIHIYVFGCLFSLIGLYTTLSFIRLWWIDCLFVRRYSIPVHVLIILMCGTRSLYLLYDGYGSLGILHAGLNNFLYRVTFPCLTSAFSILFYSLLKTTLIQLVPASIQKIQVLASVITVHFFISLAADVLMVFYTETQVILFVCHAYFITWGIFLFIGYICISHKLRSRAAQRQNKVIYTSPNTSSNEKIECGLTLSTAVKVMFCTALLGIVVVGMEVYAVVEVYKIFTRGHPKPWTWWLYHTGLRTLEVVMCATLSYVVSLPHRYRRSENKCSFGVFCAPCSAICCCCYDMRKPNSVEYFNQFHVSNLNSAYNDSFTEHGSKKLVYNNHLTDIIPTFDIQPPFGSRPNSLLIVEDGYVRFQTDYDINKIVDSCNDLSQRPADVHSVSTFLRRDGFINTGYTLHSREDKDNSDNNNIEADLTAKSRKSSVTNSDFFKVPSSVSLADSMENELDKAFESFKMDTSVDDYMESRSSDRYEGFNFHNPQERSLNSAASIPMLNAEVHMTSHQQSKQNSRSNEEVLQNSNSSRRLVGLPRTAKSPKVCRILKGRDSLSETNMEQKQSQCLISRSTSSPGSRDSPNVRYFSVLDNSKEESQILNPEDSDHDTDVDSHVPTRRPSEGQGSQAAVLTSLLKSWDNENIDV